MFGFGSGHKKADFNYIPRFYDEQKEDLQNRIRAIKEQMGEEASGKRKPGSSIRGSFTSNKPKKSEKQIQLRNSNIKLVVILIGLSFLIWKILSSDFIQDLMDRF